MAALAKGHGAPPGARVHGLGRQVTGADLHAAQGPQAQRRPGHRRHPQARGDRQPGDGRPGWGARRRRTPTPNSGAFSPPWQITVPTVPRNNGGVTLLLSNSAFERTAVHCPIA